jgi:chromosome partitioning protein
VSRFIAIANQKGGVGKTTTTVNLAASLARFGQRVLVLDMDPQGNASSGLGIAANAMHRGIYEVLTGSMSVEEAVTAQASPGVDLLPSGQRLIGAEVELVSALARERILEKGIQAIRDEYDILLADCPPSLGLLTVNTLTAADTVLIPMQCEYYALEGLTQLLNTIKLIQQALNPRLEIEGILLTMFDARLNLSHEVAEETRKFFPGRVYETVIPRNVRLSEAPSFGKPVLEYDPECAGAQFYLKLAREVLNLPEDAEPIALPDMETSAATDDGAEQAHLEAATESLRGEAAPLTEDVPAIQADLHSEGSGEGAISGAMHPAPGPDGIEAEPVSDPALDRDALEVAEIAARFTQAVDLEAHAMSPATPDVAPQEVALPTPDVALQEHAPPTPDVALQEVALPTPDVAPQELDPVLAHNDDQAMGFSPPEDNEQPVALSTDDLADDVLTLPEDSIVLAEEIVVPEPAPYAGENQSYDATAHQPQAHASETPDPDARYNDLQPMTTQDAHHPQEELVSHD